MKTQQRNIGRNRERPRIWLEGQILTDAGFKHGDRFDTTNEANKLIIKRNPDGKRKIAGKKDRPIIDMLGRVIESSFDVDLVSIVDVKKVKDGILHLTPHEGDL